MPDLSFADVFTSAGLAALVQVILIDLTMAGDNVVIMGTIASGLPREQRRKIILIGVALALLFLIGFALVATALLQVPGLLLAGGVVLLWVAFNMQRELRHAPAGEGTDDGADVADAARPTKTFTQAVIQVALADLSMSLDNVLAVAGAAREHPTVLFIGLAFSVTVMGIAATFVAQLIQRFRWIAWIGLAMILYVAGTMIWEGWHDVAPLLT
ncbi:YjbE family putative metal transport protein [Sphingomonas sp. ASV193]|uniref:YjbE family putative metal transport protein n=1 Tax=Sphingomonas sp. ASV193 TaxID=3144405 RepID=UPI0032E860EF